MDNINEKNIPARNVCRYFILHTDFIPPSKNVHDNWEYFAFGYYDGLTIGDNINKKNDSFDLRILWEKSLEIECNRQAGFCMNQVIYGFRTENQEIDICDEEFWYSDESKEQYPVIFFSMLQLEKDNGLEIKKLFACKKEIEEQYSKSDECKCILYFTLENSDIILILRCKEYDTGARMIDKMHHMGYFYQIRENGKLWKVKYSFTIPAIKRSFLNKNIGEADKWNKIESAYIFANEHASGSINKLYNEINCIKDINIDDRLSVLGYNDEVFQLKNISWKSFLGLYRDNEGLLNHSNPKFQNSVAGITTVIGIKPVGNMIIKNNDFIDRNSIEFCQYLRKDIDEIANMEKYCPHLHKNMILSLYRLVESMSKFERGHISENLFFPTAMAIHLLIQIVKEVLNKGDNELEGIYQKIEKEHKLYEDYRKFLDALDLYAQNPIRSDRQLIQAVEYNVRVYNMPVKINAFYNAFIYYIKEFLSTRTNLKLEMHKYEFIVCPGVSVCMSVEELFWGLSANKRVFRVNMPENEAYNMKHMMIMLCHEVAHFVGSDIRSRQERIKKIKSSIVNMVIQYYKKHVVQIKLINNSLMYVLETFFEKKLDEKNLNYELLSYKKSDLQIKIIFDKTVEMLKGNTPVIIQMITNEFIDNYNENCNLDLDKTILKIKEEIYNCTLSLIETNEQKKKISIKPMLDKLMWLCKECLSDIISIIVLDIKPVQYLETLWHETEMQGQEAVLKKSGIDDLVVRAAMVINCISKENSKGVIIWDEYNVNTENADFMKFVKNVNKYIACYIIGKYKGIIDNNDESIIKYISDKRVLNNLLEYLNICKEKVLDRKDSKKYIGNQILGMFKNASIHDIETQMCELQEYIEGYHVEITGKLKRIGE